MSKGSLTDMSLSRVKLDIAFRCTASSVKLRSIRYPALFSVGFPQRPCCLAAAFEICTLDIFCKINFEQAFVNQRTIWFPEG